MKFYDRLERISNTIDWAIEDITWDLKMQRGYLLYIGSKNIKDIVRELHYYADAEGRNEAEQACFEAGYNKAVELFNKQKYWWMEKI